MSFADAAFAPPPQAFSEVWHAQVLAMADELKNAGLFSADEWAQALGEELRDAQARGEEDTEDTYFLCALAVLEMLCRTRGGLTAASLSRRHADWEAAYRSTPHGDPVVLSKHSLCPPET